MKTREEHLQACKDHAMAYWREGDLENACASMVSELNQHEETKHNNEYLLALGIIHVVNKDYEGMRSWIEGFR